METPPNATPQPFRQPVSTLHAKQCMTHTASEVRFLLIFKNTHTHKVSLFLFCSIFRVFLIEGWRAPSRGRKASPNWTGPAASDKWFCLGFVVLTRRGKFIYFYIQDKRIKERRHGVLLWFYGLEAYFRSIWTLLKHQQSDLLLLGLCPVWVRGAFCVKPLTVAEGHTSFRAEGRTWCSRLCCFLLVFFGCCVLILSVFGVCFGLTSAFGQDSSAGQFNGLVQEDHEACKGINLTFRLLWLTYWLPCSEIHPLKFEQ